MGYIFGNSKRLRDTDDHELLATCYRCGHKQKIKYMREVGYNVHMCQDCVEKGEKQRREKVMADGIDNKSQFYKADTGKPTIHYVPMEGIRAVARVREYGHKKYGDGADRFFECDPIRYVDAAFRHLMKIAEEGLDSVDEESGLPHSYHLATNAFFMIEIQRMQKENKENKENG